MYLFTGNVTHSQYHDVGSEEVGSIQSIHADT